MLDISVKLEKPESIQRKIDAVIQAKVSRLDIKAIRQYFISRVSNFIEAQPAWRNLRTQVRNSLMADFGISPTTVDARLDAILSVWQDGITVRSLSRGVNRSLSVRIYGIPSNFSDVKELDEAIVINNNRRTGATEQLHWLEWLLLRGGDEVVDGYHVVYGTYPNSRSGQAIMQEKGSFQVPSSFQGTQENNLTTDAIQQFLNKDAANFFRSELLKVLQ